MSYQTEYFDEDEDFYDDEHGYYRSVDTKGIYAVLSVNTKTARNGDIVSTYVLRNQNGIVNAVSFNDPSSIKEGDIIMVQGQMGYYNFAPQINIISARILEPDPKLLVMVLPSSQYSTARLKRKVKTLITKIKDPGLNNFVDTLIHQTPNYYIAPAGKRIHHAWLGGLAEHSIQVANIVNEFAEQYNCNKDIVIAGALLHDIGKTQELTPSGLIDYSVKGRLMGHVNIGVEIILSHSLNVSIPQDILDDLKHIILSHHGEPEYGSPIRPTTKEALLVHLADRIDSEMVAALEQIRLDRTVGDWTSFDPHTKKAYRKK